MSDKHRITLGYHPWGEEIVPPCFFLREAGGCSEHYEEEADMQMSKSVWQLVASRKINIIIKWGKPCYFSQNQGYYIEVANFIFKITEEEVETLRETLSVELTTSEKYAQLEEEEWDPIQTECQKGLPVP